MNDKPVKYATEFFVEVDPNEDKSITALKVFETVMNSISDENERHRMAVVNAEWIKAYHESKLSQVRDRPRTISLLEEHSHE